MAGKTKVYTRNPVFCGTRPVLGKDVVFEDGLAVVTKKEAAVLVDEFGCSLEPFKAVDAESDPGTGFDDLKKLLEIDPDMPAKEVAELITKWKVRSIQFESMTKQMAMTLGLDPETVSASDMMDRITVLTANQKED